MKNNYNETTYDVFYHWLKDYVRGWIKVIQEKTLAAVITFTDHGIPYNPLEKEDPDTSLSAREREIGGLGIYIVKSSEDDISYEYAGGRNVLRIKRAFDTEEGAVREQK